MANVDLKQLFGNLTGLAGQTRWGFDNPEAMARIVQNHPEFATKQANVIRRLARDVGNSGLSLGTSLPGGSTVKDLLIGSPMSADVTDQLGKQILSKGIGAVDDVAAVAAPRINRLMSLYKTLT